MKMEDFVNEDRWDDILEKFLEICPAVSGTLVGSRAIKGGGYMLIYTGNSFLLPLLKNPDNAAKLRDAIRMVTGETYAVRAKYVPPQNGPADGGEGKLKSIVKKAQDSNIPVEN